MRETTLQTNKRLSFTLRRERSPSGIKASYVERICLYEHNLPFVRDTSGFCTIVIEHDVLRLQVSIDDAFLVQVTQSHRDLGQVETVNRNKQNKSTSEICFPRYLSLFMYLFIKFSLALYSIPPTAPQWPVATVLFWLQHTPLFVQQLGSHNHHFHLQAVFRKQTNVCCKSLSLST